ncbi:MAG: lytic murein transglycosylase B [Gammaproteobacteria bacterium]|nr:lytic murein transglycosylase B [Gammaproteobacteria bacterium]
MPILLFRTLLSALVLLAGSPVAFAIDTARPDVKQFIDRMVEEHAYDRAKLESVLAGAESKSSIIDAISKPAEGTLEWHQYRKIFLTDERIEAGAIFWKDNEADLARISEGTGVPIEILVGIIGVETYFGRITGSYRVLDALATLAFDYPPRSKFFSGELEQFLLLVREEGMNATDATGSYAGAMGRPQFMPSSYRAYAVDSTDDGKRDIWENWADVIGSIANYFVRHGWQTGKDIVAPATLGAQWQGATPENTLTPKETVTSLSHQGVMFSTGLGGDEKSQLITLKDEDGEQHWVGFHNFFVITRYNRSVMYALAVHQLGQEIALEVSGRES